MLFVKDKLHVFLYFILDRHSHRRMLGRRQLRNGRPPEILPDPHKITVHRNEDVVLKCRDNKISFYETPDGID